MSRLEERLQSDLTTAMKDHDEVATSTLRMVRAAVMNAAVAGVEAVQLSEEQVVDVLRSEAKKRSEAAEVYAAAGRSESASKELAEHAVIERYLPAAMGDDELQTIVDEEIARAAAAGAAGPKGTGVVIKAVRERAGTGADRTRIAAAVKASLGSESGLRNAPKPRSTSHPAGRMRGVAITPTVRPPRPLQGPNLASVSTV